MLKLFTIAVLTATVSLAAIGAAEAKKPSHHQAWLDSLKSKGGAKPEATTVGEAFDPNPEVIDVKAECLADGGLPKNQIEADGSIGIRCVPAYMFEQ